MARMMIQVAVTGGPAQRYRLAKSEIVVGRSPQADVVLDGDQVSRAHARLSFRDGRWRLSDCNSANGVYLDRGGRGTPFLARNDLVRSGDQLYIGKYQLSLFIEEDNAPSPDEEEAIMDDTYREGERTVVTNRMLQKDELRQWIDSTPPEGRRVAEDKVRSVK